MNLDRTIYRSTLFTSGKRILLDPAYLKHIAKFTTNRWIHTALAQRFVNDKVANEKIISSIPSRRWGTPDDFKGISVFLASRASDYVNGARIFLDSGTHSM